MGKVHRIKRRFRAILAQEPWKTLPPGSHKNYQVWGFMVGISIGVRSDGSVCIWHSGDSYKMLMRSLIREWHETGGVAPGDKGSVTS